jgi:hypothetical protein
MNFKSSAVWKSDLFLIAALFSIVHLVHFAILIFVELYMSSAERPFLFDWYSMLTGFSNALSLNALVAAVLIFLQLVGLNNSAGEWSRAGKMLCLTLPAAPLLDFIFHIANFKRYTGYKNIFASEIPVLSRISEVIIPGNFGGVVDVTLGHRILFVTLSLINAGFIFKYTRSYLKSMTVLVVSYVSVCAIIGALSPSDVPPATILKNLVGLPVAAWAANVFLIRRIQSAKIAASEA